MKKSIAILSVAGLAAAASAQPSNATFIIEASNDVSPGTPTTTITVSAAWDEQMEHVFSGANYDLVASDGEFTSADLILMFTGNNPGTPAGSRVNGASIGQIHLPPAVPGMQGNPMALASYDWTTTDFTPRTVNLSTENTTQFRVTPLPGGTTIDLLGGFTAGSGSFNVVPAPSALALLGLGGLVAARRRR
jgi:MYXO-CTERM domain-containing protein